MVVRVYKTNNYTVMSNYHLREKEMSLRAKGLLSLMLSLPDDWSYSIAGLVSICKENEFSIKSILKELQDFGYVKIEKLYPNQTNSGRIEYAYDVYEVSQKQENDEQGLKKHGLKKQEVENQAQLNNNIINNTKIINNKNNNSIYEGDNCPPSCPPQEKKEVELMIEHPILTYWNSKKIIVHKPSDTINKAIAKALKEFSEEEIKLYIDRYVKVINDTLYYYDYKWTLVQFLSQKNGMKEFTNEGSKWINYLESQNKRVQSLKSKKGSTQPSILDLDFSIEE